MLIISDVYKNVLEVTWTWDREYTKHMLFGIRNRETAAKKDRATSKGQTEGKTGLEKVARFYDLDLEFYT